MKTVKFKSKALIIVLLTAALLSFISTAVYSDTCQIIRIERMQGSDLPDIKIVPEKITVPIGTCTVWVNWIRGEEVQVSFRENAKQCILSTETTSGFEEIKLEEGETCYMNRSLPMGQTTSLYWTKAGTYKYRIEVPELNSANGKKSSKEISTVGIIEVR